MTLKHLIKSHDMMHVLNTTHIVHWRIFWNFAERVERNALEILQRIQQPFSRFCIKNAFLSPVFFWGSILQNRFMHIMYVFMHNMHNLWSLSIHDTAWFPIHSKHHDLLINYESIQILLLWYYNDTSYQNRLFYKAICCNIIKNKWK